MKIKFLAFSFAAAFLAVSSLWANGPTSAPIAGGGFSDCTITTKLLEASSKSATKYSQMYGVALEPTVVTALGHTYNVVQPTVEQYAKIFKNSGGPRLRAVGINFRFLMGYDVGDTSVNTTPPTYTNGAFLIYQGFLCLMIAFFWFGQLNNVSKGKGGLEIIPLVGKLCMGLVVVYNMPWVYGVAMTLKNVGEQIVLAAFTSTDSQAAVNLAHASPKNFATNSERAEGVKLGVQKVIAEYAYKIQNASPPPLGAHHRGSAGCLRRRGYSSHSRAAHRNGQKQRTPACSTVGQSA